MEINTYEFGSGKKYIQHKGLTKIFYLFFTICGILCGLSLNPDLYPKMTFIIVAIFSTSVIFSCDFGYNLDNYSEILNPFISITYFFIVLYLTIIVIS